MCHWLRVSVMQRWFQLHRKESVNLLLQTIRHASTTRAPITPNSPSCFQPWHCWRLCWEIDVGPPLFTLLQPKMLTNGARSAEVVGMITISPMWSFFSSSETHTWDTWGHASSARHLSLEHDPSQLSVKISVISIEVKVHGPYSFTLIIPETSIHILQKFKLAIGRLIIPPIC